MSKYKIVNVEIANIYKDSTFQSEIISQSLIWENLEILDNKCNWFKIRQWDCYEGWIHNSCLVDENIYDKKNLSDKNIWHTVQNRIVRAENTDSNVVKYLSFGSVIPVIDEKENCYISIFPNEMKFYLKKNDLVPFNSKMNIDNIVRLAIKNLGTPYMWGGKSGFGYDCSGFIQSLYKFAKINLPRDSKDQIKYKNLKQVYNNYNAGDLIFFGENKDVSHVGMLIDEINFIHCSGEVKVNSLDSNESDFCESLYSRIIGVYRLTSNE